MKLTFLGAGSTIFAKNVVGDCILAPEIGPFEVALHDIDPKRLEESRLMIEHINKRYGGKATVRAYADRKESLRGADFVVNAIQVGGYEPCTVTDFEVPKKFGLRQTIGDTLGIGGIFRALRTLPVLEDFARDIEEVCPNALFLNYVNPMAMLTGYLQRYTGVKTIGLCHSVQVCVPDLMRELGMEGAKDVRFRIAGINHQAWLLEVKDKEGHDLYPEIKRRALLPEYEESTKWDRVRLEIMRRFGYYVTESSEHNSEYMPYFIKARNPELIDRFHIPLDEYPRRCVNQIADWEKMRDGLVHNAEIEHTRSREYASRIIAAVLNNSPCRINANVLNTGHLIGNLPEEACVEVTCLVDGRGVTPTRVGNLPEQCAALNRTNINVQLMTIEAYRSKKKEDIYMAAYLDPHTSAELTMDEIQKMCDALIEAHGSWLPAFH